MIKRPFRFLAIIGLLVLSFVAVWRGGLLPGPAFWHDDMRIGWAERGEAEVMTIELRNIATRTHWRSDTESHRIDIQRHGPTLYELNIRLIDQRTDPPLRRDMNTRLQLEPGRTLIGSFRFFEPGESPRRQIVEILLPPPAA